MNHLQFHHGDLDDGWPLSHGHPGLPRDGYGHVLQLNTGATTVHGASSDATQGCILVHPLGSGSHQFHHFEWHP